MLWVLFGILAALISGFYYKVVICGDRVDVPALKKKSSEDKSRRSQRNLKSPKVKSLKVKSPKGATQDVETCASPTKSERIQSQIKVDKPTTPAPIDDQTSEGRPTTDVLTAKEPSQILDLTPEITPLQVKDLTAVEPTQTEVIQGNINPDGPTLPAPIDIQSDQDPTEGVLTAKDPTPSDVKQSRINNDLTAPDVMSAETSTARDPTASEVKQVSDIQENASKQSSEPDSGFLPLDSSQMSVVSDVPQLANESSSEAKDASQSGPTANEPEIKKDNPSGADGKEKKKKHKKKKHSKKDGEKSKEGGEKKKRKRSKKKLKSKDEGTKSKEDGADPGAANKN